MNCKWLQAADIGVNKSMNISCLELHLSIFQLQQNDGAIAFRQWKIFLKQHRRQTDGLIYCYRVIAYRVL